MAGVLREYDGMKLWADRADSAEYDSEGNRIADSLSSKANIVQGASAGNFAGLNASGNLVDSGYNSGDLVPACADRNIQVLTNDGETSGWSYDRTVPFTMHIPDSYYNPLGLPPYTIRIKMYDSSVDPTGWTGTWTRVQGTTDTWDCTYENPDWTDLFSTRGDILEVLGGNTSNVTNMSYMFNAWNRSTQSADSKLERVALFDTSNVVNMEWMFCECHSLVSVPAFDTSNVTTMEGIFDNCEALAEIPFMDMSNVTMLDYAFEYTAITTIPSFNTENVTSMNSLFAGCTALETIPLINTINVEDMSCMFEGCSSLVSIPLLDTSNVNSMYLMFAGCESLTTIPLLNTSNVTTMEAMFNTCESLISVPLLDTKSVTNMDSMFESCGELVSIPLFDTTHVTAMDNMFDNCVNVQTGALALYTQASTQANPPETYDGCFTQCGTNTQTGAAELAQIPASWGGTAT